MNKLIVIGGSAGSFKVVTKLLSSLPGVYKFTIVLCLHRLKTIRSGFADALSLHTKARIIEPYDNEMIRSGRIYLAPANYHLMIEFNHRFSLSVLEPRNHSRPSIDMTMDTAAEVFKEELTGIILSGANSDGAKGARKIRDYGGNLIVQDPAESEIKTMPESCLPYVKPENIMSSDKIINRILKL